MNKAKGKTLTSAEEEGGYYAIKGFLYQFDKTLIEVLRHPQTNVAFENRQDIDYEDYVLQVKHKETQTYAPSKIRKPVESLLEFFSKNPEKKLCLYCHFSDKQPEDWRPTLEELDSVISSQAKKRHNESVRGQFLCHFTVRFSEDYEAQFRETLGLIKASFSLREDEEAVLYHSIFRSRLLDRSLLAKAHRHVCLRDLKHFLEDAEVTVFQAAYSKYMGADKYARLIRKRYFTFSAPNVENFERLFLVECDSTIKPVDLIQVASRVGRKFFRKGKSPQPYLVFRNISEDVLKQVKQALFDQGIHFFDGTHFDGDRLRLDELATESLNNSAFILKIALAHEIEPIIKRVKMKEVFQFFVDVPAQVQVSGRHCRIQVEKTEQILQMIS